MASSGSTPSPSGHDDDPRVAKLPETVRSKGSALLKAMLNDENKHEAAFERFLEAGYARLEDVTASSTFLASVYEGQETWLAKRIGTQELIQEMSAGQAILTCVVASEWVMERDYVRLVRLADGMLAARLHLRSPDCLDLMLAMASSLALIKGARATVLVNHVEECRRSGVEVDLALLNEAKGRLEIADVIGAADQATREMWDLRLQQPGKAWDWEGAQERQALRDLGEWLTPGHLAAAAFSRVVPRIWWDLWESRTNGEAVPALSAAEKVGEVETEGAGWMGERLASIEEEPAEELGWENRLRLGWFLGGGVAGVLAAMVVSVLWREDIPVERPVGTAIAVHSNGSSHEEAGWVEQERGRLAEELIHVGHIGAVKAAGWAENSRFLSGNTPELPMQSQMYRKMLVLLHLDPPIDAETRAMVPRLLLRRAADEDLVNLWEQCVKAGLPLRQEIAAAAREALDEPSLTWTAEQRTRLERLLEDSQGV